MLGLSDHQLVLKHKYKQVCQEQECHSAQNPGHERDYDRVTQDFWVTGCPDRDGHCYSEAYTVLADRKERHRFFFPTVT